jgi:hypothetical protein
MPSGAFRAAESAAADLLLPSLAISRALGNLIVTVVHFLENTCAVRK